MVRSAVNWLRTAPQAPLPFPKGKYLLVSELPLFRSSPFPAMCFVLSVDFTPRNPRSSPLRSVDQWIRWSHIPGHKRPRFGLVGEGRREPVGNPSASVTTCPCRTIVDYRLTVDSCWRGFATPAWFSCMGHCLSRSDVTMHRCRQTTLLSRIATNNTYLLATFRQSTRQMKISGNIA